ncbi:hypothetical protein DPMN_144653 [Dreissena polymorpha]|uniref:Uncharacterized protein n=1 Tax=Dreissena polymorpha TaxID=45954 RepID=A0A9D4F561_DREPO|nr:hypothetical protein DPMN_144653 [Dreissena polymorpha]
MKIQTIRAVLLSISVVIEEIKTLNRQFAQQLDTQTTPLSSEDIVNPTANNLSKVQIRLTVPLLDSEAQNEILKRSHTLATINEDFPSDLWTHVYTDGSASRAVEDGGAGIRMRYPSGRNEKSTSWPQERGAALTKLRQKHS